LRGRICNDAFVHGHPWPVHPLHHTNQRLHTMSSLVRKMYDEQQLPLPPYQPRLSSSLVEHSLIVIVTLELHKTIYLRASLSFGFGVFICCYHHPSSASPPLPLHHSFSLNVIPAIFFGHTFTSTLIEGHILSLYIRNARTFSTRLSSPPPPW